MTDECNHEQTEMTIVGDSDDYPGFELEGECLCCAHRYTRMCLGLNWRFANNDDGCPGADRPYSYLRSPVAREAPTSHLNAIVRYSACRPCWRRSLPPRTPALATGDRPSASVNPLFAQSARIARGDIPAVWTDRLSLSVTR